jgi:hypothetical protein
MTEPQIFALLEANSIGIVMKLSGYVRLVIPNPNLQSILKSDHGPQSYASCDILRQFCTKTRWPISVEPDLRGYLWSDLDETWRADADCWCLVNVKIARNFIGNCAFHGFLPF